MSEGGDERDEALDSAPVNTNSVGQEKPKASDRVTKLATTREIWYVRGTFIVSVFPALTVTSMGGLLPGVQPVAVSGGVPYSKWEHSRHRAGCGQLTAL
jgi:hypothetical protein